MGKTLIIAEKPSVAGDIVKALPGKFTRSKTHFESDQHIVSYAIGHLVSIAYPEEIDPRFQKWGLDNLPILPESFPLSVLPESKSQFNALAKLIRRQDVDIIVNGCDAGREGELIFKYILRQAATGSTTRKQIKRLWLQSMTREAIHDGLSRLRDNSEMISLEETALCRSESDWLIGINATRALTGYNSRNGGFRKTPCGRVQTPTLALLVNREQERMAFVPATYWELHATFDNGPSRYQGVWIDPSFKKDSVNPHVRQNRIWKIEQAREIAARCSGKTATVSESSKQSSQSCPALYDLTSLQREANSRFGFSAKNTLSLAQALYERHKLITYPRTDSRNLPEDYLPTVRAVFNRQKEWQYGRFASQALEQNYLKKNKLIFNDKKISDHFAIIPTNKLPGSLSEAELKIYQMIVQRFLGVFFPPALYNNTRRLSVVEGETFLTEGRILLDPGWKAIYGAEADKDGDTMLASLDPQSPSICREIELKEDQTRPPARFSEATLLSAMENSGKLVDDEELAEAMKDRGLGTPATRAAIIEKLLSEKYIVREHKELVPTGKAFELLHLLTSMQIDVLASPELTGEWEFKLNQILRGGLTRAQFMTEIRTLTARIVEQVKAFSTEGNQRQREASFSPVAGRRFLENPGSYISEDKNILVRKILGGRIMQQEEIVDLLQGKTIGPFDNFRSKKGKPFTASIHLQEGKVTFIFPEAGEPLETSDGQQPEVLGLSPVDQSEVYETPVAFLSKSAMEGDTKKGLRISKTILGKRLDREHISQLLRDGRTELITGFISRKKRPFDAFLLLDAKGKISFEFPPSKRSRRGQTKTAGQE